MEKCTVKYPKCSSILSISVATENFTIEATDKIEN